jgi:hypothetical protein
MFTLINGNLPQSLSAIALLAYAGDRTIRARRGTRMAARRTLRGMYQRRGPLPYTNVTALRGVVYAVTETCGLARYALAREILCVAIAMAGTERATADRPLTFGDVSDYLTRTGEKSLLALATADERTWVRETARDVLSNYSVSHKTDNNAILYAVEDARAALSLLRRLDRVTPDTRHHRRDLSRGLRIVAADRRAVAR